MTLGDAIYLQTFMFFESYKTSSIIHNLSVANSLWNSMLEPVAKQTFSTTTGVLEQFLCPAVDQPYIFTATKQLLTNSKTDNHNITSPQCTNII